MSVRAMNWAMEVSKGTRLSSSERLVLMILAHHHYDRTNGCFPTVATIADLAGLSERRVQMTLRALEAHGLITIATRTEHGRQRSNQYDLFGKLRGEARVTPKGVARGEASVTPDEGVRGDKKSTPQKTRGVKPASPDREYTPLGAEQHPPEIIAFPRHASRN